MKNVKPPAQRAGLLANTNIIYIVPLDPAYPAPGGTGHVPVNLKGSSMFHCFMKSHALFHGSILMLIAEDLVDLKDKMDDKKIKMVLICIKNTKIGLEMG